MLIRCNCADFERDDLAVTIDPDCEELQADTQQQPSATAPPYTGGGGGGGTTDPGTQPDDEGDTTGPDTQPNDEGGTGSTNTIDDTGITTVTE